MLTHGSLDWILSNQKQGICNAHVVKGVNTTQNEAWGNVPSDL